MQPVNTKRHQEDVTSNQAGIAAQAEKSSFLNATVTRQTLLKLGDDVVSLSKDRSAPIPVPSVKNEPSIPVNSGERKALFDSFSVYI